MNKLGLDWSDLLALIGILLLGAAAYRVGGMTALIFYTGGLFVMTSLIVSYKQGRDVGK